MSVLSSTQKRRRRIPNKVKLKSMGDHNEFLSRIKKTLYYGDIPLTERFSLPVSELAAELYSNVKSGHSLERLCVDDAAEISRNACVSPCSLILALFYLERLKTCNPDYIDRVSPSELFVVSMMVASKFLHDDGEEDEVFNNEWANSAGIEVSEINRYEKDFLNAISWEVFVNETAFWTGLKGIEREVARREGRRRGWFSYTELVTLLDLIDSWSLAHTLVMVSVVCLTSYTASVLTLVGSAMIASQISLVPASIIQSNLQPAHSLNSQNIIIDSSLNNNCLNAGNNLTCFESTTESVNSWTSYMLSTSTEFSWFDSTTKSIENNDSHMNFIDKYDSLSRFHSDYNNDKSGMVDMMKMMIFSMESEKIDSHNSLINYFTDVQHSYNSLVRKTTSGTDAVSGSMNWLNNLFYVLSSSSPSNSKFSSPISLPVIDVTI